MNLSIFGFTSNYYHKPDGERVFIIFEKETSNFVLNCCQRASNWRKSKALLTDFFQFIAIFRYFCASSDPKTDLEIVSKSLSIETFKTNIKLNDIVFSLVEPISISWNISVSNPPTENKCQFSLLILHQVNRYLYYLDFNNFIEAANMNGFMTSSGYTLTQTMTRCIVLNVSKVSKVEIQKEVNLFLELLLMMVFPIGRRERKLWKNMNLQKNTKMQL